MLLLGWWLCMAAGAVRAGDADFGHFAIGAPQAGFASPVRHAQTSIVLMGGGQDVDGAFRWMIRRAGVKPGTGGRFVVQIGAFSDDAKARDARGKVEKLGLKTYTQAVETPSGKRVRVRVGPYATKAEADRAAARIKSDGLPAAVLSL